MEIQSLELHHFRNYISQKIEFGTGQNIIWGNNGEGKTSVLEGIYLLALTKSFKTYFDREFVQSGENGCAVFGSFQNRHTKIVKIELRVELPVTKKLFLQGNEINKRIEHVGLIPVVCLSPDDHDITKGGPEDRRRWIDLCVSQSNKLYLHALVEYKKALKQRNKLLIEARSISNINKSLIETWNEILVEKGCYLVEIRRRTIQKIDSNVDQILKNIIPIVSSSKIEYHPSVERADLFFSELTNHLKKEIEFRRTLIGPHRDEIHFEINGKSLRMYGSQGEHKIFLIALKCAEGIFLEDQIQEKPVLLLDDVFSELDTIRAKNLIDQLKQFGQTLITTTKTAGIPILQNEATRWLQVNQGVVSVSAA